MDKLNTVDRQLSVREQKRTTRVIKNLMGIWALAGIVIAIIGIDGIVFGGEDANVGVYGLSRAFLVTLALATALYGAIWATRTWDRFPTQARNSLAMNGFSASWHLGALAVAALLATFAAVNQDSQIMWVLTAIAAFWAFCFVPRWLNLVPAGEAPTGIPTFSAVIGYQMTIGWLHLFDWGTIGSVLVLLEGVAVIAAAVMAIRAANSFGRVEAESALSPLLAAQSSSVLLGDNQTGR